MSECVLNKQCYCSCHQQDCGMPCDAKPTDLFANYLKFNEIEDYLKILSDLYGSFVRLHIIGYSVEHHPIYAIVIDWCNATNLTINNLEQVVLSYRQYIPVTAHLPKQHRNRRTVLIEAGTHGCEWLSIATAIYCIQQLIEENLQNREILRTLRFVIVPLVNPDGYKTSQTKRKWSRNAKGVNCDQNYDINWSKGCECGSLNAYRGEFPFSEPESRALRNLLHVLGSQLMLVISLHAFDQAIMYPLGYNKAPTKEWRELRFIAERGCNAIKAYSGRPYQVGSLSKVFGRCMNGLFVDYAYEQIKVPFVYCMELPARTCGFQPAKGLIRDFVMESWVGIREMCINALHCMPHMAHKRLLRSYKLPNFIEHCDNFNDPLYYMDLTNLCDLVERDTPVVTGEQEKIKILTCTKGIPWKCRVTGCSKGRKSQKGYNASKPISPSKKDFLGQKSLPDTTKQCCDNAMRTYKRDLQHLPGFTEAL